MSNIPVPMPQEVFVRRTDPVYMAHAYLTKVPVAAIEPFIGLFTEPGETVVDPFAGSGMTGVAAAALGRRARLFDISVLGRHIGRNYVNLVDPDVFRQTAKDLLATVQQRLGNVYEVRCQTCGRAGSIAKRVWSAVVECAQCNRPVNIYKALESAGWRKSHMVCSSCGAGVTSKTRRIGEEPVLDYIDCRCSHVQIEQAPSEPLVPLDASGLTWPNVAITPDRQMYKAQALGRSGLTTIASFYAPRNLAVLACLRAAIAEIPDSRLRDKLLFAFTAILTRASKRYQWSIQRPLNAANANYYVAPVFYEWSVPDLFLRKVEAALRSDEWLRNRLGWGTGLFSNLQPDVQYDVASAGSIPLPDHSVDYIFMDPPFGSNLFYADMALFQEAWLGEFTDVSLEAVIDRGAKKVRTASRYETLLAASLRECRRVLRHGKWLTMVFGNSNGAVWALVQRAVRQAGLVIEADTVAILNKGQRSVKGLASGFENVATMDLILSMKEADSTPAEELHRPSASEINEATNRLLGDSRADSPSHLYLELLRHGIRHRWDLSGLDLRYVTTAVQAGGWDVDPRSGRLVRLIVA